MFSKSSEKSSLSFKTENDKPSSSKRRCKESNSESKSNWKEESKCSKDSSKTSIIEKSENSFESPVGGDTSNSSL